ncbi:unnamed protein product [Polarella glacialis]|uniref:Uncharacterized protein n=1 Tax=Polarella glacialis TaxID=89957 RepID=A0A813E9N7_POLGL|nr:unnamed protein product [Polarella glacialis]CAE8658262.1 unnamed protein product [Polarella glacialis]
MSPLDSRSIAGALPQLPHIPDVHIVQMNSFAAFFFMDDEEVEEDSFKPSTLQRSASDGKLLSMSRAAALVRYNTNNNNSNNNNNNDKNNDNNDNNNNNNSSNSKRSCRRAE